MEKQLRNWKPEQERRQAATATEKELAYYVSGNVLEPIGRDYLYSELVNPIFTKNGDNVKVKVVSALAATPWAFSPWMVLEAENRDARQALTDFVARLRG